MKIENREGPTKQEIARRKIEGQVMDRFNYDRSCYTRFFDCGPLGWLEIDWVSGQWRTGWYPKSPVVPIAEFLKNNRGETEHWEEKP